VTADLLLLCQRIEQCILARERASSSDTKEIWLLITAGYFRLMDCIAATDTASDNVLSTGPLVGDHLNPEQFPRIRGCHEPYSLSI
jgi:hypothetical protein